MGAQKGGLRPSVMAAVALAGASLAGCTTASNTLPFVEVEADGAADAPCPDEDGDGFAAASCGGDDCDDGDPSITAERGSCIDATTRVVCDGASRVAETCGGETPLCNAASDRCVPLGQACGDGLLHQGEECDDRNGSPGDGCSATCTLEPCATNADCPEGDFVCGDLRTPDQFWCRPINRGGSPLGSRCETDGECESGWCDMDQLRCSRGCADNMECVGERAFCVFGAAGYYFRAVSACAFGCLGHDDCPEDRRCIHTSVSGVSGTFCAIPHGDIPQGEPCDQGEGDNFDPTGSCETNGCGTLDGRNYFCTGGCFDDSDCHSGWTCGPGRPPAPPWPDAPGWPSEPPGWCCPTAADGS